MTFEADVSAVFKDGVSIWSAADVRSALQSSSAATVRRTTEAPLHRGLGVRCCMGALMIDAAREHGAEYARALWSIALHSCLHSMAQREVGRNWPIASRGLWRLAPAQMWGEPSPGADVGGGRAQSRCRCGRGVSPVPVQMCGGG